MKPGVATASPTFVLCCPSIQIPLRPAGFCQIDELSRITGHPLYLHKSKEEGRGIKFTHIVVCE